MSQEKAVNLEKATSDVGVSSRISPGIKVDDKPPASISDEKLDQVIGNLLRVGVIISSLVVLVGATLFLARHGSALLHFRLFKGEPESLRSVFGVVREAASSSRGIMQLGLLLMIATPIMRVLFTLVSFVILRDAIYVVITFIVLTVLLFSLTGLQLWDIL